MPVIKTVKGRPRGRYEWSSLQRELVGAMIDTGIYYQTDLARHLGLTQWTLNRTLRGRRANPQVLKKLEEFIRHSKRQGRRRAA